MGSTTLIGVQPQLQRMIYYGLLTESLNYARLMDAPPKVLPMFVGSTYRITALHYTYGYATLSAAYVGYL